MGEDVRRDRLDVCQRLRHSLPDDVLVHRPAGKVYRGRIVTQATYANYQTYGDVQFPSLITIRRPLDEYSLKVEITKLALNGTFEEDQFELKIPPGVVVKRME